MKKSRATKSAPDCSLRPLQVMMGIACTRMPLVTDIRSELAVSINQNVGVLSASFTPKSLSAMRARSAAEVGPAEGGGGFASELCKEQFMEFGQNVDSDSARPATSAEVRRI